MKSLCEKLNIYEIRRVIEEMTLKHMLLKKKAKPPLLPLTSTTIQELRPMRFFISSMRL